MLKDSSHHPEGDRADQSGLIDDVVNQAMVLAQRHASELGLSRDESKVLFAYTFEQLMVTLYMHHPEDVGKVIERVRSRGRQDFRMTSWQSN